MRLRHVTFLALGSILLLTACRKGEVVSYRVPKEAIPPPMAAPDMASTAVPTAQGHDLTWVAPAGWESKPASAMRRGSYVVHGADGATADMAITAFPGDVGGDLANINRWRGQIHLPPVDQAHLAETLTQVQAQDLTLTMVDMANPNDAEPKRILGALVSFEGNTWFFKLMGPDALVAAEKAHFVAFLKTIKGHTH